MIDNETSKLIQEMFSIENNPVLITKVREKI